MSAAAPVLEVSTVDKLPVVMRGLAFFVPASHVFEGMRPVLLGGAGFPGRRLAPAFVIDVLYVLGAARLFSWSLRQVRARGLPSRFGG